MTYSSDKPADNPDINAETDNEQVAPAEPVEPVAGDGTQTPESAAPAAWVNDSAADETPEPEPRASLWERYHWLLYPLVIFLVTRAVLVVGGYSADRMLVDQLNDSNTFWETYPEGRLLDQWASWDGMWYRHIANQGYVVRAHQGSPAYFPLYPVLIHYTKPIFSGAIPAGFFVSNLSLLIALIYLYRLTELEFGNRPTAQRAVLYIAIAPTAFYFSALYTESLYLMLSVIAFYYARRGNWLLASFAGAFLSATRIIGILILGAVGLEWLRAHGWTLATARTRQAWVNLWNGIKRDWLSLVTLAWIPFGLLAYMAYLNYEFGDPFYFRTVLADVFDRSPQSLIDVAILEINTFVGALINGRVAWNDPRIISWYYNFGTLIVTLVMSVIVWLRLGAVYGAYTLLVILLPFSGGSVSMPRYVVIAFPLFMLLAHWGRYTLVDRIILVTFIPLLGVAMTIFVNWGWVA